MASGSRHFKGPFHARLSFYVGKVELEVILLLVKFLACIDNRGLENRVAIHECDNVCKRVHAIDLQIIDDGSLTDILARHDEPLVFVGPGFDGNRQCATNGLKGAVESQFPYKHIV